MRLKPLGLKPFKNDVFLNVIWPLQVTKATVSTKMLNNALVGGPPISGKGGKKGGKADKNGVADAGGGLSAHGTIMKDFRLELAKSGASKCGVCEEKIKKVCHGILITLRK